MQFDLNDLLLEIMNVDFLTEKRTIGINRKLILQMINIIKLGNTFLEPHIYIVEHFKAGGVQCSKN